MNTRRVHELMTQHFPPVNPAARQWAVVESREHVAPLLAEHIGSSEVLVEVHRKLGASLPAAEAATFAADHMGEGEIRIADRTFTGFVVVAQNGVATGWRLADNQLLHPNQRC